MGAQKKTVIEITWTIADAAHASMGMHDAVIVFVARLLIDLPTAAHTGDSQVNDPIDQCDTDAA